MIHTRSLLKGYQVLVGWITLDLALAIAMLIAIDFPDEEQMRAELIEEYEDTALAEAQFNYGFQLFCHFFISVLSITLYYANLSSHLENFTETGMVFMMMAQFFNLMQEMRIFSYMEESKTILAYRERS